MNAIEAMRNDLDRRWEDLEDGWECYGDSKAQADAETAAFGDGPPGSALDLADMLASLNTEVEALARGEKEYLAVQGLCAFR